MAEPTSPIPDVLDGHVIIAGYGIVGRCVAESLAKQKVPFCIVELNPATVNRMAYGPVPIIEGDIRHREVLDRAGFARCSALALAMPDETHALEALKIARAIRPEVKIIVRCTFSSAGMQAVQLGAAAVVAEQAVAREFTATVGKSLSIAVS